MAVCRYQPANCSLPVGETARLMAASSKYCPTETLAARRGGWNRVLDQIQTLRDIEEGRDIRESGHLGLERQGRLLGALGGQRQNRRFCRDRPGGRSWACDRRVGNSGRSKLALTLSDVVANTLADAVPILR